MSDARQHLMRLTLEQRARLEQRLLGRALPTQAAVAPADASPKPLSFAQESLWFFDQLVPHSPLYNIPQAFRLRGPLDRAALQRAFTALVERQQALRTRIVVLDGVPSQEVQSRPFELQVTDLADLAPGKRDKELLRLLDEEAKRPFNLRDDLMLRARLIALEADSHVLTLTLHHIVSDFASLEILYRELGAFYSGFGSGEPRILPELRLSFVEWAARERTRVESGQLQKSFDYWKDRFQGSLPILEMPCDRARGDFRTFGGSRRPLRIAPGLTAALRSLAQQEGVTLYTLLLAAFKTFLYRYSGQEDILVGSPISSRSDPATEGMIGFLLNTVVLRTDLSDGPTFPELLRRVREVVVGALAHQEVPFEKLVETLRLPRPTASNPLCQVIFQYLPSAPPAPVLNGLVAEPLSTETGTAKFDLTLTLMEEADSLAGDLESNSDLFDAATVERWLNNFQVLLQSITASPGEQIGRLALLTDAERQTVLLDWNQTASFYPRQACVHELFEDQVKQTPDTVALTSEDRSLTYLELNRQANQFARVLGQSGVKPGDRVGLCIGRSPEMVVSLLAILKAGATYVPLDPHYPVDRLRFMLREAEVSLIVTNGGHERLAWSDAPVIFLDRERNRLARESDANLPNGVTAESLAYVMFTSGSTGQAKGVAIPHRSVVRLVKGTDYARFDPDQVFLQFAPLCFDASTFEIWGPLLNGARLVLYPPEFESLEQFIQVVRDRQVTTLWLTAGLFHQVVEHHLDGLTRVRQLLAGGDVLSVPHVTRALRELPYCQLINGYGPTENTTFTCCYHFPQQWKDRRSAPIGRPINNTQVYLLDDSLAPVPIGARGDLCIGGDGLAREYVHSPELNAQKFIRNPFSTDPQSRLYRTGDQARYLPDGTLEFLGRLDDQVKINGFRIHLAEIEAALQEVPGVRQATVLAREAEGPGRQVVAYVVSDLMNPASELRRCLADKLPSYMVPSHFIRLESFPLTPNGKVDRQALPAPTSATSQALYVSLPPQTPIQERIAQAWREVFAKQDIGIDDNFFDLGGHSLLATRVVSRLNQAFQANLSLSVLFSTPTVRGLAEKVSATPAGPSPGPITRRPARKI